MEKAEQKGVSGIDYPTDDGFLFTDESQIKSKTDQGLVLDHDGHSHFIFYADLKGTKWAYLIPEGANLAHATRPTPRATQHHGGAVADNYVFNPADIVAEDAFGYTVRHGDHYHYIPKTSLSPQMAQQTRQVLTYQPKLPSTPPQQLPNQRGISGLDYATSDGFLFDGSNITGTTDTGILVNHNGHLHPISFEELRRSKWGHIADRYQNHPSAPEVNDPAETEYETKRAYLAQQLHISPDKIQKITTDKGEVGLQYPHHDHHHVALLKDIDVTKPFEDPDAHMQKEVEKTIDGETLEARKERLINEFIERYQVKREDITVSGNYISVRHGDHAHTYKIDPNLPDDPERDIATETTNLEVETQTVYGPFYTEGPIVHFTRDGVYQHYHVDGIKNIKNFVLLQFSTNSQYGDLEIDGKKVKTVYYLVRKDLDWKDLHITQPTAIQHDGRVFKGWSANLPSSGKMSRDSHSFYALFDKDRKTPTKDVYGPGDDIRDLDLSTYVPIKYSTITNGRLNYNGTILGGITYYVKPGLTWKQARENGVLPPTPVPNDTYEFIEWRDITNGSREDDAAVSTTISMAAFGTTAPYIGPYVAQDPNNPASPTDPSRHPNYYWHDPKHYVAVAFKAGENGELVSALGRTQTLVYLVRKGTSLAEAGIYTPTAQPKDGYSIDQNTIDYTSPVTEDKVYTITFKEKTKTPAPQDIPAETPEQDSTPESPSAPTTPPALESLDEEDDLLSPSSPSQTDQEIEDAWESWLEQADKVEAPASAPATPLTEDDVDF
ncbi:pneumococcal-type histidine triad protein [Streptococcus phocae]|uniref:pneumococcal-type histidine triad protein n=1 Tax=Streptococcus phocae TaxID=119224 RepID=UPI000690763B|nr:pneumococcal-type histidine triad protein [Streptococcus phocae]